MQKTKSDKRTGARTGGALLTVAVAATMVMAFAVPAQAQGQGGDAEITVEWHEDGMGFNVTSSKDISNIIVTDCLDLATHKHEYGDNNTTINHTEVFEIKAIWVKSGNNHNESGPQPPAPFDNPGAGEYFENPNVTCEGQQNGETRCDGPADVTAIPQSDGSIKVNWTAVENASQYNVYRAEGGGDFSLLTTTDGNTTMHTDQTTEVGKTYHYRVTAIVDQQETQHCDTASATAIPVFPTIVAGALAASVGIAAYATMGRRRS